MKLPDTAALYSDLAPARPAGSDRGAQALFTGPSIFSIKPGSQSSEDTEISRTLVHTLAAQAEFLGRLGRLRESIIEWDRALGLAADADFVGLRLGRAATVLALGRLPHGSGRRRCRRAWDTGSSQPADPRLRSTPAHPRLSTAIRPCPKQPGLPVSPPNSKRVSTRSAGLANCPHFAIAAACVPRCRQPSLTQCVLMPASRS